MNNNILEVLRTIQHYNHYTSMTVERLAELVMESLALADAVQETQKQLGTGWSICFRYLGSVEGWECIISHGNQSECQWSSSGHQNLWESLEFLAKTSQDIVRNLTDR